MKAYTMKRKLDRYFQEHGYAVLGGVVGGLISSSILTAVMILCL